MTQIAEIAPHRGALRTTTTITAAHGHGIEPEIMETALRVLRAAEAPPSFGTVDIGVRAGLADHTSGIPLHEVGDEAALPLGHGE